MIYKYTCECNKEKEIELPLGSDLPKVVCDCGKEMKYDFISKWKTSNGIIIPEKFKAASTLYDKQKMYGKFNTHEKQLY